MSQLRLKYFPPYADYPKDSPYLNTIETSAGMVEEKLRGLDYQSLDISDYCKRYYTFDLRKITFMLQAYSVMLASAIQLSGKAISEIALLDHGAGIGILSLLAKLSGIKTVIHQDIDPVISADAKVIGQRLGIPADHYIGGETKDFVEYVNQNNLNLNIVGSRNVIEHIYNIEDFFSEASRIQSDRLVLYLNTTANAQNPLINVYTKRLQRIYERDGFSNDWGSRKRDKNNAALEVRKRIIREHAGGLRDSQIQALAINTRGQRKDDIIKSVDAYIHQGSMPVAPAHPTNTCDPLTGSWYENLLSIDEYKKIIAESGFDYSFKNGFYNENYPQWYLNLISPIINRKIRLLRGWGIFLAPFITLIAVKK
jgi:hypothetical protein